MNEEFSEFLNKFLIVLKKQFGITSKSLANVLDISPNTLTNWKKSSNNINRKLLQRFLSYIDQFYKTNSKTIDSDISLKKIINQLYIETYKLCNKELSTHKLRKINEEKLLDTRRKYFKINFNKLICFIKQVANLYEVDYDTDKSDFLKLQGYQKKELYDNLISLKLISRNVHGYLSVQKELAKILDVSEAQVSRWKNGLDYPSNENLLKLAFFCNKSSEVAFSLFELNNDDIASMFIKSPYYAMRIEEFEREYFDCLKLVISQTIGKEIFSNLVREKNYLLAYEDEDTEIVKKLLFRDCIILLKESFDILNLKISFENWLIEQTAFGTDFFYINIVEPFKLDTNDDFYKYAEKIDDGFKFLRNYLSYNQSFYLLREYVLTDYSILNMAVHVLKILHDNNQDFSEWYHKESEVYADNNYIREGCRNLCASLTSRKKIGGINYFEAFFEQFWKLILYKNIAVNTDIWPVDSIFPNDGVGILYQIEINYKLVASIISNQSKEKNNINIANFQIYNNLQYLEYGKELFEEILFSDSSIEYKKKFDESGGEFDIVKDLEKKYQKVLDFQTSWT
ncbi:hypothetical protein A9Q68_06910 [Streptococcus bovimastitidis]|uniref:HTH cro/C1-type domain-containing protein n=1 Tax=Streptococcus bovimastitidis TaxID=1856638 RepID=A0A1L8MLV1_9STRE|nr:helix-turn-helix transcriptional regulator [Streptococcus bovimastitidis]OJF71711.1 hypothetical protein A9Q68_06910 [Streptococcus bovimastitidis]